MHYLAQILLTLVLKLTPDLSTAQFFDGNKPISMKLISYKQHGFSQEAVYQNGNATTTISSIYFSSLTPNQKERTMKEESNKEKKECCDKCRQKPNKIISRQELLCMNLDCPCHSDPLTSLLQSAEEELEKWPQKTIRHHHYHRTRHLKDFVFSKLTEAFNKGKEMR